MLKFSKKRSNWTQLADDMFYTFYAPNGMFLGAIPCKDNNSRDINQFWRNLSADFDIPAEQITIEMEYPKI